MTATVQISVPLAELPDSVIESIQDLAPDGYELTSLTATLTIDVQAAADRHLEEAHGPILTAGDLAAAEAEHAKDCR